MLTVGLSKRHHKSSSELETLATSPGRSNDRLLGFMHIGNEGLIVCMKSKLLGDVHLLGIII